MNYINSFTEKDLCDLILKTRNSLYICLPLLQPEVMRAIHELKKENGNGVSINIGLDFSPETFRQGYGEIESFEINELSGYNIQNFKDNRISFILSDDTGYFLFFESRYFIPANKSTLNAVSIDPISIIRLKQHFFEIYRNETEYKDEIANSFIDETVRLKTIREEFNQESQIIKSELSKEYLQQVTNDLKSNPPLKPDYQRIVTFYTNKFQYVRFEYKGANLKSKKVDIPSRVLPIRDANFKQSLESKLNLFKNKNSEIFNELNEVNNYVKLIREKFLTPLSSRKVSLLMVSQKEEFKASLIELEKILNDLTNKGENEISNEIETTKKDVSNQLISFFSRYNEELPFFKLMANKNKDEIIKEIQLHVKKIVNNIDWPDARQLLDNFKLDAFYSDITYEDLKNKELINELIDKGLIDSAEINNLAELGKSIELKG